MESPARLRCLLLALTAQFLVCSGQNHLLDSKDTTFVVGFPAQDPRKGSSGKNRLYITADEDTEVYLEIPDLNDNRTVQLRAGGSYDIALPGNTRMDSHTGGGLKGIRITANVSVSVYGLGLVDQSSDGFLALPVGLLGTEYIVPTYAPSMNAFVMVIAVHDDTRISFKLRLSGPGFITYRYMNFRNGDTLNVTLAKKHEAFQILADSYAGSLSGTRVTSSKVISVYSGNDCANVPINKGACDHLVEQVPPVSTWGRTFLVKATEQRPAGDLFQILASANNTVVRIETASDSIIRNLNAGDVFFFDANYTSSYVIVTSKPSLVTQYSKGSTTDGSAFAPFMSIIPSTDQFSNDFTLVVPDDPSGSFNGYATIYISSLKKSGVKITSIPNKTLPTLIWQQIPNSVFSVATLALPRAQYRFYHTSPLVTLSVIFYGVGNLAAFGFPAGFRISRPPRDCVPTSMVPGDRQDNDCDGKVDEEILNGIDDDRDGLVDEDLVTRPPVIVLSPTTNSKQCTWGDSKYAVDLPSYTVFGMCNVRDANKMVHQDIAIHRSESCWIKKTREWTLTDGCGNIVKKTQNLNVLTPSPTTIDFPKDAYGQCPASAFDVNLDLFGRPRVTSACPGDPQIESKDSGLKVLKDCGYVTPVAVTRMWKVTDVCMNVTNHKQTIYFQNQGTKPTIRSPSRPISITKGQEENITLTCTSVGTPTPLITWVLPDGSQVNSTHYITETEVLDDLELRTRLKRPQPGGSLLITDSREVDTGVYVCIARNVLGNDTVSANVTVRKDLVDVDASITLPDEVFDDDLLDTESERYVELKTTFEWELTQIFINMSGFQEVDILGFRNGSVKVLFRVVVKTQDKKEKPEVAVSKVGKHLSLKVKGGRIGSYKVIPTAALQEKPPPPKELQASNVKKTEVHITWAHPELYGMYSITGYLLQYKEFGSSKSWKTYVTVRGDNHRIGNLEAGTSYSVRLKSKNKYGHSEPSENLEFATQKGHSGAELALMIVVPLLVIAVAIALGLYFIRRKRRKRQGFMRADTVESHTVRYCANPSNGFRFDESNAHWRQIPREAVELGRTLGEGEFGKVIEGNVTEPDGTRVHCAVKKLKRTATESDWKDLLNELDIMVQVGEHPNIVNLIGACSDPEGPLMVIVEFCGNGNLLHYLQKNSNKNYSNLHEYVLTIPARERLRIAADVASGMAHLEKMRCVHRDLAARNVLLDEALTAKVSDFGLSRDIYTNSVYEKTTGGKLPAKWMAIESIEAGLYTSHSDAWSFGVLLWEIETGGCIPYPTFTVQEMLNSLKKGYRLEKPPYCLEPLYTLMLSCWSADPALRPHFVEICARLKQLHDVTPQIKSHNNEYTVDGYEDMSGRETYA